jgi:hypothetical protein
MAVEAVGVRGVLEEEQGGLVVVRVVRVVKSEFLPEDEPSSNWAFSRYFIFTLATRRRYQTQPIA